jgi:hypothetical protein
MKGKRGSSQIIQDVPFEVTIKFSLYSIRLFMRYYQNFLWIESAMKSKHSNNISARASIYGLRILKKMKIKSSKSIARGCY